MEQPRLAAQQFGAAASAYLTSTVHAQGADLARLTGLAQGTPGLSALDLGCGAGHASYALAQGGAQVTAYDLSPQMLAVVDSEARARGLTLLTVQEGPAEQLPFEDASFDLVVSRLSAHHWHHVPNALNEIARVLRPGGTLIMIDVISPEPPLLDTFLQTVEVLRDPSHVRDYRISEWMDHMRGAGMEKPAVDTWTLPIDFATWTARMKTPDIRTQAIRHVIDAAPDEVRDHFQMQANHDFRLDIAWMETSRGDVSFD